MNLTDTSEDNMKKPVYKIGLGLAIALIVCLFPMPYGYYTLVRFATTIFFGCIAFDFYTNNRIPLCITASSIALLFQPFLKITLEKTLWNIIDIAVAILLIILWYKNNKELKE